MRLSPDDPSSFNRFADAIQEVANAAARATSFLGRFVDNGGARSAGPDSGAAPAGMYAETLHLGGVSV